MRLELSTFRAAGPAGLTGGLMSQWRVGAIVEAIAARDVSDGQLWLNIGATRVPARIASGDAAGPRDGERLQLRVLRDHPVLALETIEADTNETTVVGDALRRHVPRQTSPAPLLANLEVIAKRPTTQPATPAQRAVQEAVQKLWQALPQAQDLEKPENLAQAVNRSGIALETKLTQADPTTARQTLNTDLKALLLNLKQVLQRVGAHPQAVTEAEPGPLPTARGPLLPLPNAAATLPAIAPAQQLNELAAQVDGALSRIQTVQLTNSETPTAANAWLVEIPLRREEHADTLRMRFERHSRAEAMEQSWTVEAAMDLGATGSIYAKVSLYGKRIGVQLRAEPPQLVAELNAQTTLLSAMLSEAGLEVDRVVCMHGMPTGERDLRMNSLLDIRV